MTKEDSGDDRGNRIATFDGLKDVFNTILVNFLDQVRLLEQYIASPYSEEKEKNLDKIDAKNDYFTKLLRTILLRGIFLPINKHDFRQSIENFEIVMDLFQRINHHLWLIVLPDWINDHLRKMIEIIRKELNSLNQWFTIKKESIEQIDEISNLENEADIVHREFLRKLYSESIDFKVFTQASLLDQTLEDITDEIENLSRQIHIILNEYRTMVQPPPHYLP